MPQGLYCSGARLARPWQRMRRHSNNTSPLGDNARPAAMSTCHGEPSESHSRITNDTVYTKGYPITMQFIHFPRTLTSITRASLALVILALTLVGPAVAYPPAIAFNPQPDPPGVAFNPQPDPPGRA